MRLSRARVRRRWALPSAAFVSGVDVTDGGVSVLVVLVIFLFLRDVRAIPLRETTSAVEVVATCTISVTTGEIETASLASPP